MQKKYLVTFFLVMELLIVARNILVGQYARFFWFCDIAPLLFAIAFALEDDQFIKGLISVGFIAQALVVIFICAAIFFNMNLFHYADVLKYGWFYVLVTLLTHLVSVNVAIFFSYRVKPLPRSLLYSGGTLLVLLISSLTFTPPADNVNFVYTLDFLPYTPHHYLLWWLPLSLLVVVVPAYYAQLWFYHYMRKAPGEN